MSKIELFVTPKRRIYPATAEDQARLRTCRPGEILVAHAFTERNPARHRWWRAFLAFVAENHPDYRSADEVNYQLKLDCGFTQDFILRGGEIVRVPKSTAYDQCSEADFDAFTRLAYDAAFETLLTDVDPDKVAAWVDSETEMRKGRE